MTAVLDEIFGREYPDLDAEPRRRLWTRTEFYRMADHGVIDPDERLELLEGVVVLRHTPEPNERRWSCDEYEAMGGGVLGPEERVELIDGVVLEMSPQRSTHATGVSLVQLALQEAFGNAAVVRVQLPLRLFGRSEPEPDVAVVTGSVRDYTRAHPEGALLVVEVSDTTLAYDRSWKAGLYAAAGIEDYWICNLVDGVVEVHRQPIEMPKQPFGYSYGALTIYSRRQVITPLAVPDAQIVVSDLLPDLAQENTP